MIISRISAQPISVMPLTDRVHILGAHLRPYGLAVFMDKNISELSWLINTKDLFGQIAVEFSRTVRKLNSPEEMFEVVESAFLNSRSKNNLSTIQAIVQTIEQHNGRLSVVELAKKHHITPRTLRNYFYKTIGCSPKEFLQVVRVKQAVSQIKDSDRSLTELTYEQHFADQSHFTHTLKNITGLSPRQIKENIARFRFLQF